MEGNGAKAEGAKEDGYSLCFVYGAGEDDGRLPCELVKEVDEVEVFVFLRKEHV